jgi:hypothetical protein
VVAVEPVEHGSGALELGGGVGGPAAGGVAFGVADVKGGAGGGLLLEALAVGAVDFAGGRRSRRKALVAFQAKKAMRATLEWQR